MATKKISLEELTTILSATVTDEQEKQRILVEVRNYIASQEDDQVELQVTPAETRDITILFGSAATLERINTDEITAITVKVDAAADHNRLIPHIMAKALIFNQNLSRRSRRNRANNLAEALGTLSPKTHLEGFPKRILHKQPSLVLKSTNLETATRA